MPDYFEDIDISFYSKRIFILGPSHHVRLSGCALTETSHYQTPLYDLTIDQKSEYISTCTVTNEQNIRTVPISVMNF